MNIVLNRVHGPGIVVLLVITGFAAALLISPCFWIDTARAEQSLKRPTLNPRVIYTGIPTKVRIAIRASYDPKLISSSVNLLRVRPDGSKAVVARMYDDGTRGDLTANDWTYTAVIELNEPNPAILKFQVSAGYKGQALRVLSDIFTLEVQAFPNLEETWNRFVSCLVNKDMEGAVSYIRVARRDEYRRIFSQVGMDKLSTMFAPARNFKLKEIMPYRAEYTFTAINLGKEAQGEVFFFQDREWDDVWRIDFIGF